MNNSPPLLILLRGLPGSGKSTFAKNLTLLDFVHCEADQFFETPNGYCFDPKKLPEAHAFCLQKAKKAISDGKNCVVANTFVRKWELEPYLSLTQFVKTITMHGSFKNIHGVPDSTIQRMILNWED